MRETNKADSGPRFARRSRIGWEQIGNVREIRGPQFF